ncbi:tnp_zf-ribbon_2 domain-containing protein [Trichonephila clavipes]|nr:tnp_zf-ribbon_2 domain-containing protein [Trichonephila clavipes]
MLKRSNQAQDFTSQHVTKSCYPIGQVVNQLEALIGGVILISKQKSHKMKLKSVVSLQNPTPVRDGNLQERVTFTFLTTSHCQSHTFAHPSDLNRIPWKLWKYFTTLPSDIESDESSLGEAEDVVTAKSSSSENTNIDEENDDNSYSGPVKLKFRKHTVSEKDRRKNVGRIPTKCKSRRCAYCSTRAKPHRTRWVCCNCDVVLCMIVKSNDSVTCFEKFHKDWK